MGKGNARKPEPSKNGNAKSSGCVRANPCKIRCWGQVVRTTLVVQGGRTNLIIRTALVLGAVRVVLVEQVALAVRVGW